MTGGFEPVILLQGCRRGYRLLQPGPCQCSQLSEPGPEHQARDVDRSAAEQCNLNFYRVQTLGATSPSGPRYCTNQRRLNYSVSPRSDADLTKLLYVLTPDGFFFNF